jgi:hypothetical protein
MCESSVIYSRWATLMTGGLRFIIVLNLPRPRISTSHFKTLQHDLLNDRLIRWLTGACSTSASSRIGGVYVQERMISF